MAQDYPLEWKEFTSSGYLYDVQFEECKNGQSVSDLKENLLNAARTNLARQISIRIEDKAQLNKKANDGQSSVAYQTQTSFSTEANMHLVFTATSYDSSKRIVYAIAYVNKQQARDYYSKDLSLQLGNVKNSIAMAKDYVEKGQKAEARENLHAAEESIESVDNNLFWLNVFDVSLSDLDNWQTEVNNSRRLVNQMLTDVTMATTISYDEGTYTGDIMNGIPHGYGRYIRVDTTDNNPFKIPDPCNEDGWGVSHKIVYDGEWKDGKMEGNGSLLAYNMGNSLWYTYEGEWKDGLANGKGIYDNTQIRYEGSFVNGKFHGHGKIFNKYFRETYEGDWRDGNKEGTGTLINDRGKYVGEFRYNSFFGKGEYHQSDGTVIKGHFSRGQITGPATIQYKNGAIEKGTFREAERVGPVEYFYAREQTIKDGRKTYKKVKSYKVEYDNDGKRISAFSYFDKEGKFLFSSENMHFEPFE